MSQQPTLDADSCFEIAARLTGAIALLSDYDDIDTSDELQYARRLLHDALKITNEYADAVDGYTHAVARAGYLREQEVEA